MTPRENRLTQSGAAPFDATTRGGIVQLAADRLRPIQTALLLAIVSACVAHAEPYSRFGLCVAPTPPDCVHSSSQKKIDRDDCAKSTTFYMALVFAYRACLSAEMERAVREANETLRTLKCARGRQDCRIPLGTEEAVESARPPAIDGE